MMLLDPYVPVAMPMASAQPGRGSLVSVLALVRDQSVLQLGLQACIATDPGLQWLEPLTSLSQLSPDVVLIDADATAADCQIELDALRQLQPTVPIVLLQGMPAELGVNFRRFANCAAYVVDKSATPRELVAAIQAAHRGERSGPRAHAFVYAKPKPMPKLGHDLTPRERELLKLLVTGASNKKIATQLTISMATVKFHVTRVLAKLGAGNRTVAVLQAIRHGLVQDT